MQFVDFLKYIPKIEKEMLMATPAHSIMAPLDRINLMKNLDFNQIQPKKAGVLMLIYPKKGITHLVLILRNSYPGVHSSQIAFPGGKVEPTDASIAATALRETHEEIGIDASKIQIVKALSEVFIPPSNFMVYPFLGYATEELNFRADQIEVAEIIEISLKDFLDEKAVVNKKITTSYANNISVPAFKINEFFVWGATAMMLSELKEIFKKVI